MGRPRRAARGQRETLDAASKMFVNRRFLVDVKVATSKYFAGLVITIGVVSGIFAGKPHRPPTPLMMPTTGNGPPWLTSVGQREAFDREPPNR